VNKYGITSFKNYPLIVNAYYFCFYKFLIKKIMEKEKLNQIADYVADKMMFSTKEVLTSEEAAKFMGISRSYLYKLTSRKEIPHYKPMGKMCYFNRSELIEWLQSNRVATATELNNRATAYYGKGGIK
jgi:excisionase family DNA binding protein